MPRSISSSGYFLGLDMTAENLLFPRTASRNRGLRRNRSGSYIERRTTEGKTKGDIIRFSKRYVAREIYTALKETSEETSPEPLDIDRSITLHNG